ncbi:hypothetical protein ONE63_005096 [Megalurothrips usitatus]|uniref:Uncharacterized protein n=1 Tax=Megalurothrips usitatus TaxID=439358 RepID=A0AAV7Y162_9NEOP|nr:hypothetical protein ONE63_005096 [Megalurothrips usitatus]
MAFLNPGYGPEDTVSSLPHRSASESDTLSLGAEALELIEASSQPVQFDCGDGAIRQIPDGALPAAHELPDQGIVVVGVGAGVPAAAAKRRRVPSAAEGRAPPSPPAAAGASAAATAKRACAATVARPPAPSAVRPAPAATVARPPAPSGRPVVVGVAGQPLNVRTQAQGARMPVLLTAGGAGVFTIIRPAPQEAPRQDVATVVQDQREDRVQDPPSLPDLDWDEVEEEQPAPVRIVASPERPGGRRNRLDLDVQLGGGGEPAARRGGNRADYVREMLERGYGERDRLRAEREEEEAADDPARAIPRMPLRHARGGGRLGGAGRVGGGGRAVLRRGDDLLNEPLDDALVNELNRRPVAPHDHTVMYALALAARLRQFSDRTICRLENEINQLVDDRGPIIERGWKGQGP